VDNFAFGNEFLATALGTQNGIASHRLKDDPAELRKRVLALEKENANLQLLVCDLLKKNEELRAFLRRR
jgi:hypothetical protein